MLKKYIPIIIVVCVVLFTLIACSSPKNEPDTTESITTTVENTVRVTFPEGYTAKQIAEKLEESGVCSAADFMAEIKGDTVYTLTWSFIPGIVSPENRAFTLEGYIFPDTYEFYKGESAASALSRFLKNAESKLTEEYAARAEELGFTLDEIITLASIIQKEAGDPIEMPKVSSVLHNRIKSPDYGKLQCDVTIDYVNKCIIDSPYLEGDTERFKELYNTYKCDGLPAGPICNPGMDAIEAALYPEETDYFFFVTDEDWNYYYSETYSEHQKKCREIGLIG